jgi:hypothetical protein
MDVAARTYSGMQLHQINMCRIALQVILLSDITAVDGKRILQKYYTGKAHRESGRRTRLNWPPVGTLPNSWWKLWREFLCGWCGTALQLPEPLGRWFAGAEMLTQCCFFLHGRRLIMQQIDQFYVFEPYNSRTRTRYQTHAYPILDVAFLSTAKVVDIVYKSQSIFIVSQSEQSIIPTAPPPTINTLQDLYNDLQHQEQNTHHLVII